MQESYDLTYFIEQIQLLRAGTIQEVTVPAKDYVAVWQYCQSLEDKNEFIAHAGYEGVITLYYKHNKKYGA